ncbi:hypothetical protein [Streptomyces sp. NRRL B-1140]|uniref:hypothetical protein n=1 Tax=Streptomyces sp. NRRL B-1140 TaxID=1415549 RepID=UPI0006AF80B5|nr:hypothetical protein [Streptomyces sp. NRRL B-1140]
MAHVEPAHLVELALGNATPTEADTEALRHVDQCARCRDELSTLTRLVTAARTARLVDLPTAPPERVWRRISGDLSPETRTPEPPPRIPDRRRRALLALLALATATVVAVALRCLHGRSRVVRGGGVP